MEKTEVAVIGAGVVGLAVADRLARHTNDVIVLEQHSAFGQETSSRNSEVIHAGIYYTADSLRARLCVEGKQLLYDFCEENGIPHRCCGKLIVATSDAELEELEGLRERGVGNGVEDLRFLSRWEIDVYGPTLSAHGALYSPSTGIVDSHSLMKRLEYRASQAGVLVSYNTRVVGIEKRSDGYVVDLIDADGEEMQISAQVLVNCAGLHADKVAAMLGLDVDALEYRIHYVRGEYCRVGDQSTVPHDILVYPTPVWGSLGAHTVVDLQGQVKLGPFTRVVEELDYDVESLDVDAIYEKTKSFLPQLRREDLTPDMAGISPSLKRDSKAGRDFIIKDEGDNGLPGLVNLVGIQSPGLTSSLAIGRYVAELLF